MSTTAIMVIMHAELPYREVVNAPPPESVTQADAHQHADAEHVAGKRKRFHHHLIDNVKEYLALVIVAVAISVIVPLIVHFYHKHIASSGTTTTTVTAPATATTTTTTTPAPAAPAPAEHDVSEAVQDPGGAMAHALTSPDDTSDDDSDKPAAAATTNIAFLGKGRYQLYRQGNITWRLDTDSGHASILFATAEEWRKERVLSHGCGND